MFFLLHLASPQREAQPGLIPPSNNDLVQAKEGSGASISVERKLICLDGGDNSNVAWVIDFHVYDFSLYHANK